MRNPNNSDDRDDQNPEDGDLTIEDLIELLGGGPEKHRDIITFTGRRNVALDLALELPPKLQDPISFGDAKRESYLLFGALMSSLNPEVLKQLFKRINEYHMLDEIETLVDDHEESDSYLEGPEELLTI